MLSSSSAGNTNPKFAVAKNASSLDTADLIVDGSSPSTVDIGERVFTGSVFFSVTTTTEPEPNTKPKTEPGGNANVNLAFT